MDDAPKAANREVYFNHPHRLRLDLHPVSTWWKRKSNPTSFKSSNRRNKRDRKRITQGSCMFLNTLTPRAPWSYGYTNQQAIADERTCINKKSESPRTIAQPLVCFTSYITIRASTMIIIDCIVVTHPLRPLPTPCLTPFPHTAQPHHSMADTRGYSIWIMQDGGMVPFFSLFIILRVLDHEHYSRRERRLN